MHAERQRRWDYGPGLWGCCFGGPWRRPSRREETEEPKDYIAELKRGASSRRRNIEGLKGNEAKGCQRNGSVVGHRYFGWPSRARHRNKKKRSVGKQKFTPYELLTADRQQKGRPRAVSAEASRSVVMRDRLNGRCPLGGGPQGQSTAGGL